MDGADRADRHVRRRYDGRLALDHKELNEHSRCTSRTAPISCSGASGEVAHLVRHPIEELKRLEHVAADGDSPTTPLLT